LSYENMATDAYGAYVTQYDTAFVFTDYYVNPMRFALSRTYCGQIEGGWKLGDPKPDAGTHLRWGANYAVVGYEIPFYRTANYANYHDGRGYVYEYFAANWLNMFSGRQRAEIYGGFVDSETPFRLAKVRAKVKTGVYLNVRNRDFRSRLTQHNVVLDSTDTPEDYNLTYPTVALFNIKNVLSDENFGPGAFTASDSTTDFHNFRAFAFNPAAYAGVEFRFPYRIRLTAGGRLEHFRQTIDLFPTSGAAAYNFYDRSQTDLLPSASLVYSPGDKINLRAAFSQTVIRPGDRDLVPLPFLNLNYGVYSVGNPGVVRTFCSNFDFRFEWFPSGVEIISASVFYKRLRTPIEQHIIEGSIQEGGQTTYISTNSERADVLGLEIEARQNLGRWTGSAYWENLTLYGNATLMRSRVNGQSLFKPGRSLQGQADATLNFGLIFTEPKTKTSLAVFFNRVSRRIALVGVGDTIFPSIYELPRNVLDVQISKTFFERLTVRFAVSDVFNNPVRWVHIYTDNPGADAFDPKRDQYIRYTKMGVNFNLNIGYLF
ncbi:MAG: TonB-dependent receptor, partial [Bacteroidia bacterium]|nr:TonB-dependent receptor [Bacteroidia bacterium]